MAVISDYYQKANEMRQKLAQISPSLCLAKWQQVTIHLHNGHTHSCHHPAPHFIPLKEIQEDVSALHNSHFKKEQRKLMLEGKRPKECSYCWNIEDSGDHLSDRHFKSGEPWASPHLEEIVQSKWTDNPVPSYVEVSFSNQCNFRCSYCSPQISSRWMKEIKDDGPYILDNNYKHHDLSYLKQINAMPWVDEETNPYIKAFWDWWPTLYPKLKTFRITGGEPLLSANTFRVLEWINRHPRPDLSIAVNTNLGIPDATLDRLIASLQPICGENKVADFTLFTSVDSSFGQAEYIRNGLNYDQLIRNIHKIFRSVPNVKVVLMCTFNALSVTGFRPLLEELLKIREEYTEDGAMRLWLDIAYLRYPPWQSVQILTPDYFEILKSHLAFMESFDKSGQGKIAGFQDAEVEKMKRLVDWAPTARDEPWITEARKNFYLFFKQHDERRGTDFLSTFPEMKDFWNFCKNLAEPA